MGDTAYPAAQRIGGRGHLGILFAQKFGYKVAAIGRGPDNAVLAKKLGARMSPSRWDATPRLTAST